MSSRRVLVQKTSFKGSGPTILEALCSKDTFEPCSDSIVSTFQSVLQKNPQTVAAECRTYASMRTVAMIPSEAAASGAPLGLSPSVVYTATDLILKQDKRYSSKPGQPVKLHDIFTVKGLGTDEEAQYVIVSGEPGMGKSMLLKYILEKLRKVKEEEDVEGLHDRNSILFAELRRNEYADFDSLTNDVLKDTLDMPVMVLLDGYDEAAEKSCELVKDVMRQDGSDFKVLITCRPQYVDTIFKSIPRRRRKNVCHLSFNGIPLSHHAEYCSKIIDSCIADPKHEFVKDKIKDGLVSRFPDIYEKLGEDMTNPLLLSILTGMWIEHPIVELDQHRKNIFIRHK